MYGVKRPEANADTNHYSYKQWFKDVYDYISSRVGIITVTTTYSIPSHIFYVRCNATDGVFTVSLPTASTCPGRQVLIKKVDASANAVTVSRSGSDGIESGTTVSLAAQWDKTHLISNGNNGWEIV